MVNSGASDFYKPEKPLKNALYKNNRDGTFTDVTDQAGVAGGHEFGIGLPLHVGRIVCAASLGANSKNGQARLLLAEAARPQTVWM